MVRTTEALLSALNKHGMLDEAALLEAGFVHELGASEHDRLETTIRRINQGLPEGNKLKLVAHGQVSMLFPVYMYESEVDKIPDHLLR